MVLWAKLFVPRLQYRKILYKVKLKRLSTVVFVYKKFGFAKPSSFHWTQAVDPVLISLSVSFLSHVSAYRLAPRTTLEGPNPCRFLPADHPFACKSGRGVILKIL